MTNLSIPLVCSADGSECPTCMKACFNGSSNITDYNYDEQVKMIDIILGAFLVPVAIVTVIIGLLFLQIMRRLRKRKIASHVFMVSLIMADIITALLCMPVSIHILLNSRQLHNAFVIYMQGILMITTRQCTMFTVLVMVIDKLTAVYWPMKYKGIFTYKSAIIITVIIWVVSLAHNLIPVLDQAGRGSLGTVPLYVYTDSSMFVYAYFNLMKVWINVYGAVVFFSSFVLTAIAMLVLCVLLVLNLYVKNKKKNFDNTPFKKATETTLLIMLGFLITYTTRYSITISQIVCNTCQRRHIIAGVGETIIFLGCLFDPIIYLWRSSNIRGELNVLVSETTHKMESVAHPSDLLSQAKEIIFFPRKASVASNSPPVQTKRVSTQSVGFEGGRIQESSQSEDMPRMSIDIKELYIKLPPQTPSQSVTKNDSLSDKCGVRTTENL